MAACIAAERKLAPKSAPNWNADGKKRISVETHSGSKPAGSGGGRGALFWPKRRSSARLLLVEVLQVLLPTILDADEKREDAELFEGIGREVWGWGGPLRVSIGPLLVRRNGSGRRRFGGRVPFFAVNTEGLLSRFRSLKGKNGLIFKREDKPY